MPDPRDAELRRYFEYFQTVVDGLMGRHSGEYALLHDRSVVQVFKRPIDAVAAGQERFSDGLFSVQRVIDRPFDLGFMSYGSGDRTTD